MGRAVKYEGIETRDGRELRSGARCRQIHGSNQAGKIPKIQVPEVTGWLEVVKSKEEMYNVIRTIFFVI